MPFNVSRAYDEAKGLDHPAHLDRRARCRDVEVRWSTAPPAKSAEIDLNRPGGRGP